MQVGHAVRPDVGNHLGFGLTGGAGHHFLGDVRCQRRLRRDAACHAHAGDQRLVVVVAAKEVETDFRWCERVR